GVGVDECAVQGLKKWHGFGGGFAGEAETESQLPRLIRLQAGSRMDVFTQDSFGMGLGDFFDFHAACGAGHEHHFAGGAIDKDAEVKFALDVHALFDQQAFDDTPCGTRLHGDQIHAQHVTGDVCRFLRGTRELYTAALAAATRVDLRLHDNNVGLKALRAFASFVLGESDFAARGGDAVARKDRLSLILVNLHR